MAITKPESDEGREPEAATTAEPADDEAPESDDASRPQADDHERWQRFAASDPDAPGPDTAPQGRLRAVGRGLRRAARSEWTLAGLFSMLLAVAMTWPLVRNLDEVIPHDLGDPLLQAYTLAWLGESLRTDPGGIWGTNSFWPAPDSFLFTDTLLGYAPLALLATDAASTLLVYNVLYIATFALAFLGAYALLRQLGARVAGSAVGAAAFAYAPWKLAHLGHLNVLSSGAIVLALAMLARGHGWSLRHGFKPERQRPGWILAGWLCALWQFAIGVALGLSFVYLMLAIGVVVGCFWLFKRPPLTWRTVAADGLGGVVFSLGVLWIADKHAAVARAFPETARDYEYVRWFSPAWQSFVIAPAESRTWGAAHEAARVDLTWPPEQTLLVGFTLLALAAAGLFVSVWSRRQRFWMVLGVAAFTALAMGPNFLDDGAWAWGLLYEYAPGFDAVRTPGRLVLYITVLLAILAAGVLTRLADAADEVAHESRVDRRLTVRAPRRVQALFFAPLVLVLLEGLSVAPFHEPPEAPLDMAALEGPVLFLPSDGRDTRVQFWTIDGFVDTANGSAAFTPDELTGLRSMSQGFPLDDSVESLREAGIETVVVIPSWLPGSDWSGMDTDYEPFGVEVERTEEAIVYDLDGS
ncbi:hypothetical protein K3N28_13595 [Glycomyces sp. TRM65418]|uniref:hypothetical protein n=1 Tax=Glycomyces sp. TRM65418 TaxID=2867006 RepID=UPI001CE4D895|nr:hypothetical protein [Glycomyces sp. TRM65418]MCC3764100.1 hypothetical protein [Glycomyces sp. TRM65418]QZD53788.1 hypothetical protein K3N28_13530 [Glycomyces sp. TRM65418]